MKFNGGGRGNERVIDWRCDWDQAMQTYLSGLRLHGECAMEDKPSPIGGASCDLIWCGDMNVARRLNDLFHGQHSVDKLYLERTKQSNLQSKTRVARLENYVRRGIKDGN